MSTTPSGHPDPTTSGLPAASASNTATAHLDQPADGQAEQTEQVAQTAPTVRSNSAAESTDPARAAVWAVVGPTAVGKSDLAIALAQRLGAQIINADSMQLYQGMDIGTAKLPTDQRGGITHHLLDIWPVTYPAQVAQYQQQARHLIAKLTGAGTPVVLVGGSGLYVKAALDQLDFPGTDPSIRQRWDELLRQLGPQALHAELARRDPDAAARIEPANGRRIVRALEVIEITGHAFQASLPEPAYAIPARQIGLSLPRPELDRRIDLRVERMWEQGLIQEVQGLLELGLEQGRTASKALGYASAIQQIRGQCTAELARQQTAQLTRRFARRQESWFRRDPRIGWFDLSTTTAEQILDDVLCEPQCSGG